MVSTPLGSWGNGGAYNRTQAHCIPKYILSHYYYEEKIKLTLIAVWQERSAEEMGPQQGVPSPPLNLQEVSWLLLPCPQMSWMSLLREGHWRLYWPHVNPKKDLEIWEKKAGKWEWVAKRRKEFPEGIQLMLLSQARRGSGPASFLGQKKRGGQGLGARAVHSHWPRMSLQALPLGQVTYTLDLSFPHVENEGQ